MPKSSKPADQEVEVDRRFEERRAEAGGDVGELVAEEAATEEAVAEEVPREFKQPRRRKERRRQIDPTTCERDYNDDEITFMQALDAYKRSSGRMFPTCSEILEVVRDLGYVKLSDDEQQLLTSVEEVEAEMSDAIDSTESTESPASV